MSNDKVNKVGGGVGGGTGGAGLEERGDNAEARFTLN